MIADGSRIYQRGVGFRFHDPAKAFQGYTLFSGLFPSTPTGRVYLIDMWGRIVHFWQMDNAPGTYGLLLPNGNLLYAGRKPDQPFPEGGGGGGELLEVDWDGNVLWKYEDPWAHHDFRRMPNGNTMVLKWVKTPERIAARVKGGVPGTEHKGVMYADALEEISPEGKVVWQWLGYEHVDPESDAICPLCMRAEWTHANGIDILPNGDVLISFFLQNTIAIIDKATGNFKWRWGPGELGHQHNPTLLDNGHILVFDNGLHRRTNSMFKMLPFSRVLEIDPQTNEIVWEYVDEGKLHFWGPFISGAQRLPNGNTLICEGPYGRLFEVTPEKGVVWEYVSPFFSPMPAFLGWNNTVFRAYRYPPDYPGLIGRDLSPGKFEWVVQRKKELTAPEKEVVEARLRRLGY